VVVPSGESTPIDVVSESDLADITRLLREAGAPDFALYKPSTLGRRIERRSLLNGLKTAGEYARLLADHPGERRLLAQELLVGVTSFFRDEPLWQRLRDELLPALAAARGPRASLRAWVAGCSTGEEAYSLAIAHGEFTATQPPGERGSLQIFASDLNADAIGIARRGHYGEAAMSSVSPERIGRHFVADGAQWRVGAAERAKVMFAQHDVTSDPPFTRLDLLLCRNLLIYFRDPLQLRLLPVFHYSLLPEGFLLLGRSESLGSHRALFDEIDPALRIYRRRAATSNAVRSFPTPALRPHRRETTAVSPSAVPPTSPQSAVDALVLRQFAPASVLVNLSGDILHLSGRTAAYLDPADGKTTLNLLALAREGLRSAIAGAMAQIQQGAASVELRGVALGAAAFPGRDSVVDLTLVSLTEPELLRGRVLVVFSDAMRSAGDGATGNELPALRAEMHRASGEIASLREDMRAAREEHQAATEELQSANEELQATNEELSTSREEMQSMNEELQTINAELTAKLDDLALAQSDIRNLLNSTEIAALFLDSALRVRRFTERAVQIVHLRDGDVGRPLSDLTSTLDYPELMADAARVLDSLTTIERRACSREGRWYRARLMPYRTLDNVIAGVVLTFIDITREHALELRAANTDNGGLSP
jgi:two-component system CheB/CheR fusion protein